MVRKIIYAPETKGGMRVQPTTRADETEGSWFDHPIPPFQ